MAYKIRSCERCNQQFQPHAPVQSHCSLRCKLLAPVLIDRRTGCWLWTGHVNTGGYGDIRWQGSVLLAHRLAYTMWNGPVGKDLCVLHACDRPRCINPDHLWLGTSQENTADKMNKGRHVAVKGEDHPSSKLTSKQVLSIYSDTRKQRTIALEYGLSFQAVNDIKRGKNWSHVTDG